MKRTNKKEVVRQIQEFTLEIIYNACSNGEPATDKEKLEIIADQFNEWDCEINAIYLPTVIQRWQEFCNSFVVMYNDEITELLQSWLAENDADKAKISDMTMQKQADKYLRLTLREFSRMCHKNDVEFIMLVRGPRGFDTISI